MEQESAKALDLSKYRTDELYESVASLLSVRGMFTIGMVRTVATIVFYAVLGVFVFFDRINAVNMIPVGFVVVFLGLIAGIVFSIAEVIRKSLDNMVKIVDLLLGVTINIVEDFHSVGRGDTELPPTRELVRAVYAQVFLPIVEKVIGEGLGFLGKPILFVYRMTLGRLVKRAIQLIPVSQKSIDAMEKSVKDMASVAAEIDGEQSTIISTLQWTRKHLTRLGSWGKTLIVIPCYVVVAIVVAITLVLMFVIYWMLGKPAEPDAVESAMRILNDRIRLSVQT